MIELNKIVLGDALKLMPEVASGSVRTIHTSPPYNIGRKYSGYVDNLPLKQYLAFTRNVLQECYRVLAEGGNIFWQTGYTQDEQEFIYPLDHLTYPLFLETGFKLKDRIIWRYYGGMSFKSKFTNKHETILWFVKPGAPTFFDVFPVREKSREYDLRNNLFGRNPGNVWEVDRVAYGSIEQTSHIAVFPEEISDRIVLTTTREGDLCLDPFCGSGTLCKVAKSRGRQYLGFEIVPEYYNDSICRLSYQQCGEFFTVLSAITRKYIFKTEGTRLTAKEIPRQLKELLLRSQESAYISILTEKGLKSLTGFIDSGFNKKEKINLWKITDDFFDSVSFSSDPVRIIDDSFMDSYKLHRVFNGAMRFALAWRWLLEFRKFVHQDDRILGQVIRANALEESGSYLVEGKEIKLLTNHRRINSKTQQEDRDSMDLFAFK